MDVEEIRRMIRQSIKEQVKRLVEERLKPPTTFENFNFLVEQSLEGLKDKPSHEEIYGMWRDISSEVAGIREEKELISEWNASLGYYVDMLDVSKETRATLFNQLKR